MLTIEMTNHINNFIKNAKYGKVIIEFQETNNSIDIITEQRKRFMKNNEKINKNIVIKND